MLSQIFNNNQIRKDYINSMEQITSKLELEQINKIIQAIIDLYFED